MRHSWRGILALTGLMTVLGACAGEPPTHLGVKGGRLAPCPSSPNCVSSQAVDDRHRVDPLRISGDPEAAFALLLQVLDARSDTTLIETTDSYLRVELRTTLFVDDGEFLLNREAGVIEVRSASRLGYWDLGKNRRRLEEIRRVFADREANP